MPLPLIADLYTPFLFLLAATLLIRSVKSESPIRIRSHARSLLGVIGLSYLFMLLDELLGLWPTFQLDYSTHTAVALALVVHLHYFSTKKRWELPLSLICYLWLMHYLGYHTWGDMLSTVAVVLPLMVVLSLSSQRKGIKAGAKKVPLE